MALYKYQALSKEGKKVSGSIDAASVNQVQEILSQRDLYTIEISPSTSLGIKSLFFKVSQKEIILFTKQLAVLLKSGVPLLQSFELLSEQFEGNLRSIIIEIKDDIKEGKSLADILQKYPKYFDTIYVQLVKAGEATGKLEQVLERLAEYMERNLEIKSRISSAMTNPIIQLVMVFFIVIFLLTTVVPNLVKTFTSLKQDLPIPTKILIAMSNALQNHYIILTLILALIVGGFLYFKSTKYGRKQLDKLKLKLPMIKFFTKTSTVINFSQTLGLLLESGVNLSDALDIVCKITQNQILADELNEAKESIIKQGKIAQYLKKTGLFPPMAIYLINTGEQSGSLDKMLLTVAKNYEQEMLELINKLIETIDPLMKVVMALVVGFIVGAIALPLMQINQSIEF